jgi:hypothetical protein
MVTSEHHHSRRRVWLYPVLVLGGAAALWFFALLLLDYLLSFHAGPSFRAVLSPFTAEDVSQSLGSMPSVVVAILGIAITVVSIILQLSATRYTPRVTEMFFLDRTNLLVMGFFVVASIHCLWVAIIIRRVFVPQVMILSTVVIVSAAILIMSPYFAYVFAFLDPQRIVARLQEQSLAEALGRGRASSWEKRQERVLEGVEQLADVAVNSVSQKDRIIASRSVDALKDLVVRYADDKGRLPTDWYTIGAVLRRNPDFVAMAAESVEEIVTHRTWLEWKVLRQYQTIYNESINRMRDVGYLVAINTRYIGEKALETKDPQVLKLAFKFFNTYLRATLNERDVRTAYNVLHQYRQLTEAILRADWQDAVVEVARHFKYYGQTANGMGLAFITETAAYDLCTLCELAHEQKFAREHDLLAIFLEVDKVPETEAQEQSLRGVRKAQVKLATYYLVRQAEDLARMIWKDMEHERMERLLSIREEMLGVTAKDFWEVIDRGHNFDYLDPARREQLQRFYSWFPGLGGPSADSKRS